MRSWEGVRDATAFGPPPPQSGSFGMDTLGGAGDDWLTVNVWSTDLGGRLPVMVWVQGGAYAFGMSGLPEYDGSTLARAGVVLVTFNYRVGLEGFGHIEGAPANRGLLDQVAALEWVRDNIGAFGGDPARVTLFGQSAGGGSVAALLVMPRAAGLFQRAIRRACPAPSSPRRSPPTSPGSAPRSGCRARRPALGGPATPPAAGDAVSARLGELTRRWGRAAHARVLFAPGRRRGRAADDAVAGAHGSVELMVGHTATSNACSRPSPECWARSRRRRPP